MRITVHDAIAPLLQAEEQDLIRRHPKHAEVIRSAVRQFQEIYGNRIFTSMIDLTEFCGEVDGMTTVRNMPAILTEPIQAVRKRILSRIAQDFVRAGAPSIRDLDPHRELRGKRRKGRRPKGEAPVRSAEELRRVVDDYLSLASQVGEHEVVQMLISARLITEEEIPHAMRLLRDYLGTSLGRGGGGGGGPIDIIQYDDRILQIQSVRRVAHRMLRQEVYNRLVAIGGDTVENAEFVCRNAGREARAVMEDLARNANVPADRHRDLFEERQVYFEQAANLRMPSCFIREILHQGKPHPLPSWRQRIAVMEAYRQRHIYVGFEPGLGKTFVPFWFHELQNEQRQRRGQSRGKMLYIAPRMVLNEIPNRVRPGTAPSPQPHCYYLPGQEPSVGVVRGGMKVEEINTQLNSEVVFMPYSMLHRSREDEQIYERLISHRDPQTGDPFSLVVFDEAHMLKGDETWTHIAHEIIHRTPNLHRDGNVLFMSGTPATNQLVDLSIVAELLERQRTPREVDGEPNNARRRRDPGLHPAIMRNMLERLIILDPPEPWEQHVDVIDYDLYEEEGRFIQTVVNDVTLHPKQKIDAILLAIRCPQLMTGNPRARSGLFDWACMQLYDDLNRHNTLLLAEHMRAQAVLRERANLDDDEIESEENLYFYDRLRRFCERWSGENAVPLRLHLVHGDVPEMERQRAYREARESDAHGSTSKTVILAHSSCLNLGIDLRSIRRQISLEWPYNSPEVQQLLKRSLRAGSESRMTVFYARGTVEEAIYHYAQDKYADIRACLYGGGISDARLRQLSSAEDEEDIRDSRLLSKLDSPEQREGRIQLWLHGKGMREYRNFWSRHRDLFHEQVELADSSGTADDERFLGALVAVLEERGVVQGRDEGVSYLHVHSHGLTLDRTLRRLLPLQQRHVSSMDPLPYMLEEGRTALARERRIGESAVLTGSIGDLGRLMARHVLQPGTFDAVVLQDLECARASIPPEGEVRIHQRARAILGAVRVLREGGKLIITLPRDSCTREEFERFCTEGLPSFGCEVLRSWTGEGISTKEDNAGDSSFRIFAVTASKTRECRRADILMHLNPLALTFTHWRGWRDTREGVRLHNEYKRRKLPYPLLHTNFSLGEHTFGHTISSTAHAQQVSHLRDLEHAAHIVHELAPSAREFLGLSAEKRAVLSQNGIEYLAQLSTILRRPTFLLAAYPNHFFYPYDPQWD